MRRLLIGSFVAVIALGLFATAAGFSRAAGHAAGAAVTAASDMRDGDEAQPGREMSSMADEDDCSMSAGVSLLRCTRYG